MLTYSDAKAVEGQEFTLAAGDGPVLSVRLTSVRALDRRARADRFPDPFSLYFKGTPGVHCQQGIYRLENAVLGRLEIFISPIGRDAETGEFLYQAIFN